MADRDEDAPVTRTPSGGGHWRRLESLFDAAVDVPDAERDAWLATAVSDDPAMRAELERLLAGHRRAGGILDRPAAAAATVDVRAHLERAIGERYVIDREIGSGGMAVVFLAHERKHERPVVLKVLKPEVGAWCGTQRFVREVQLAARLAHPNIVALIDSGDADGLLYYVMPYVEGETLRQRLRRDGALAPIDAVALLRDITDGLAHAHQAGVVHRDLKPENVLLAGTHAFLIDFGIAKSLARPDAAEHLTHDGAPIGTPAYMPPEQRVGSRDLDVRADVYAWGVLAHEMLTGTLPPHALDASPLRRRPDVPGALTRLVLACLSPTADERPTDAAAIRAALATPAAPAAAVDVPVARPAPRRRVVWVATAAAALVAVALFALLVVRPRLLERGRRTRPVAVSALTNETSDPALDAWGRMAGDWVTQGLQETGRAVVPWPTALAASDRLRSARQGGRAIDAVRFLGAETGAGTVITGSYYREGDSLRFLAEVADVARERALATATVVVARDSAHQAVRLLRDRLMAALAILGDARLAGVPELARRPPSFAAYQAFDRALQRFVAQQYGESAPEFRLAHSLDSTFLAPLLYAATAYWNTDDYARADTMLRALRDRRAALSPYHRGWAEFIEASLQGEGARALVAIRGAAELAPTSRAGYDLAALALEMDRPREALAALDRMSPDRGDMRGWSSYWTQRSHAHHLLGDYEAELVDARTMRERFPDRRVALVLEARALAAMGRFHALDSLVAQARTLPPTTYWSAGAAMVVAGEELLAHEQRAEGMAWLQQAVDWLQAERARTPGERAHRYWLGSALYSLERWSDARAVLEPLARDYPDRLQYRALAALAAARTGVPDAERMLGTAPPRDRGALATYRARLAAVRGDHARAAAALADAVRDGVDGLPWIHASAHADLALLAGESALPASLRAR